MYNLKCCFVEIPRLVCYIPLFFKIGLSRYHRLLLWRQRWDIQTTQSCYLISYDPHLEHSWTSNKHSMYSPDILYQIINWWDICQRSHSILPCYNSLFSNHFLEILSQNIVDNSKTMSSLHFQEVRNSFDQKISNLMNQLQDLVD